MKKYLIILEKSKDGYGAYVPDLPGCIAVGETKEEVEELIYESIQLHLEALEEDSYPIPESVSESEVMVFP
jgi:predicted RNase H-like HicB family nuclease